MTEAEVTRIAAGLTKAQRDLLLGRLSTGGWTYRSYRLIGAALVKKGLVKGILGGLFEPTENGLRVRALLQSQAQEKQDG